MADSWIWARLQGLIGDVERLFEGYQYGEAGRQIYEFFWNEFADWYVEIAKLQLDAGGERAARTVEALVRTLDACLRLLHPFTPFVTEELWGHLKRSAQALEGQAGRPGSLSYPGGWEQALILARWPQSRPAEGWEAEKVSQFGLVQEVVRAVRNVRSEKGVAPARRIPATLVSSSQSGLLGEQARTIAALAGLDPAVLQILPSLPSKPEGSIALVVGPVEVYLPLAGLVDLAEERQRLEKELREAESQLARLEALLAGPFAQKAPPAVVQKEREKLAAYRETAGKLRGQLESLQ